MGIVMHIVGSLTQLVLVPRQRLLRQRFLGQRGHLDRPEIAKRNTDVQAQHLRAKG
jgi:hypothetical protein